MFNACVQRFDITENLKNFAKFLELNMATCVPSLEQVRSAGKSISSMAHCDSKDHISNSENPPRP
jgi:hypothetical protein